MFWLAASVAALDEATMAKLQEKLRIMSANVSRLDFTGAALLYRASFKPHNRITKALYVLSSIAQYGG